MYVVHTLHTKYDMTRVAVFSIAANGNVLLIMMPRPGEMGRRQLRWYCQKRHARHPQYCQMAKT